VSRSARRSCSISLPGTGSSNLTPGGVSERPKEHASKACVGESPPWVQIPPPPRLTCGNAGPAPLGRAGIFGPSLNSCHRGPYGAGLRRHRGYAQQLQSVADRATLVRINQIRRGWANYFKHAVAKHTFDRLQDFIWWRVVNWVMQRHHLTWKALSRRLRGPRGWRLIVLEGIELFNLGSVSVTRYRFRGTHIPSPWIAVALTPTA
jgi:hypothetical protein